MSAGHPKIELIGREEDGIPRRGEPVTTGVPLAKGFVRDVRELALETAEGTPVPLQAEVLERWGDGSVRWVLLDFPLTVAAGAELALRLGVGPGTAGARPGVDVTAAGDTVVVDTGAARFELGRGGSFPFRSVRAGEREWIDVGQSALQAVAAGGGGSRATVRRVVSETAGPLRATVFMEGAFDGPAAPLLFFARLHFFANLASARVVLTIRNPRAAAHPGGIWELGDAGSLLVRDLSLALAGPGVDRVAWSETPEAALEELGTTRFEIYQDSSGSENWRSRVHLARDGTVPHAFRGFRARIGAAERTGLRTSPRVVTHDGIAGISVSLRRFWEEFPKAIEVEEGTVTIRLFPRQSTAPHEIQGGEAKTFEIALAFGPEALAAPPDAFRRPLLVAPAPRTFEASGAIPGLLLREDDDDERYRRLVDAALGEDGFLAKRERFDEYGWRHFGEMPADHEAHGWAGEGTFVSHYNNQYDAVFGAFHQFARSGDPRWFRIMDDLARHVADIDVYQTDDDKAAYNRGLFWPTTHYVDGGLSTHRTYPKGTTGGGPDNEHNYTTGLRYWWLLTGNARGREASLDGARRAVAADDGDRTPFRWIVRSPTGLASKTRSFDYHGPGRGAGNTIVALLDAWRTTGEERWLVQCEEIVRRTVHPRDDVAARDLLDAENRWSYTAHLEALGRYLEDMAEAGRIGLTYAWARESLLAYARWMAVHEGPTLAWAQMLEFPTETWAAQDLRKAEVFAHAAMHADGEERARFVERARWFRDESLAALEKFPTRTYTRPLVLLMRYGTLAAWLERHPDAAFPPPAPTPDFGPPVRFVPQRTRAIRRVRDVVGLAAVVGAGFALARLLGA